jgi:hypothetical protein
MINVAMIKMSKYWRNNIYWRLLQKNYITLHNILSQLPYPDSNGFLRTGKPYFRAAQKFLHFYAAL